MLKLNRSTSILEYLKERNIWKLKVLSFRDDIKEEYVIPLSEFNDVFDQWVIDTFISIGCDTAESVMALSREELIRRTDLEEETVDAMIAAVKEELAK